MKLFFFLISLCVLSHFSQAQLFATLWTVAHQAALSMGFSRQEYWSVAISSPGDLPDPGIEPASLMSPALAGRFFTTSATIYSFVTALLWIKFKVLTTDVKVLPDLAPCYPPDLISFHFPHVGFCRQTGLFLLLQDISVTYHFIELLFLTFRYMMGEGNGNPLQYSCLENPMDREAWELSMGNYPWGHKSQTQLSD